MEDNNANNIIDTRLVLHNIIVNRRYDNPFPPTNFTRWYFERGSGRVYAVDYRVIDFEDIDTVTCYSSDERLTVYADSGMYEIKNGELCKYDKFIEEWEIENDELKARQDELRKRFITETFDWEKFRNKIWPKIRFILDNVNDGWLRLSKLQTAADNLISMLNKALVEEWAQPVPFEAGSVYKLVSPDSFKDAKIDVVKAKGCKGSDGEWNFTDDGGQTWLSKYGVSNVENKKTVYWFKMNQAAHILLGLFGYSNIYF